MPDFGRGWARWASGSGPASALRAQLVGLHIRRRPVTAHLVSRSQQGLAFACPADTAPLVPVIWQEVPVTEALRHREAASLSENPALRQSCARCLSNFVTACAASCGSGPVSNIIVILGQAHNMEKSLPPRRPELLAQSAMLMFISSGTSAERLTCSLGFQDAWICRSFCAASPPVHTCRQDAPHA